MIALGIEFSTQSVKTLALDTTGEEVLYTGSINYDQAFPSYGTSGGVLPHPDAAVRHTSPLMLLDALDLALLDLARRGVDLSRVGAVKLDAMQHCTVYVDHSFDHRLTTLDPGAPPGDQVAPSLTRDSAPIWEDRSTGKEVRLLEEALGYHGIFESLCGNRVEPRFPAPQVLKWAMEDPCAFMITSRIFLLSAFLTSLLTGTPAPVDTGDGWGTNFNNLDIEKPGWSGLIIDAVDSILMRRGIMGNIRERIGAIVPYDTALGTVSPYLAGRYGINPAAVVLAGTGDNPATLLGCGGGAVISLGSSYTVNGVAGAISPSPSGEYNLFGYTPGTVMALGVFTNGAKVHDHFRSRYAPGVDIASYAGMAGSPALSDDEPLMLPWLLDESVPAHGRGIVRDGLHEHDPRANIRALHVSQVLAMRLHSDHLERSGSLCVAGGAARNTFMRRLITDIFDAETYTVEHADFAAPLGCAISGARHLLGIGYAEAARRFARRDPASVLKPRGVNARHIEHLLRRYGRLENGTLADTGILAGAG